MKEQNNNFYLPFGIFVLLFSFSIYLFFSAPGLFWEDSPQMEIVIRTLSISHSPGHPLYSVIGRFFFIFFNIITTSDKASVLTSVFLTASAITLYSSLIFKIIKNKIISVLLPLVLAFSPPVFNYSGIVETYSLLILGLSCYMIFLIKVHRYQILAFYLAGLFSGGSILILIPLPLVFILYWFNLRDKRYFILAISSFIFGLSIYLFLPLRSFANPPLDWGNTKIISNFISTITMSEFRGDMLSGFLSYGSWFSGTIEVLKRLSYFVLFIGWFVIFFSFKSLFNKHKYISLIFPVSFILYFIFALKSGKGPDFSAYLIPLYFIMTTILMFFSYKKKYQLYFFLLIMIIASLYFNHPDIRRRNSYGASEYQNHLVEVLPESSLVVVENTNEYFLLLHLQIINNLRNDIIIIYPDLLSERWYREKFNEIGLKLFTDQALIDYSRMHNRNLIYIPYEKWFFTEELFKPLGSVFILSDEEFKFKIERYIDDNEPISSNHQRVIWERMMYYFFNTKDHQYCLETLDSLTKNYTNWQYFYNKAIILSDIADSSGDSHLYSISLSFADSSLSKGGPDEILNLFKARLYLKTGDFFKCIELTEDMQKTKDIVKIRILALYFSGQKDIALLELQKALLKWSEEVDIVNLKNVIK